VKISDQGLIQYLQKGNPLPLIEFVQKFAEIIKDSCLSLEAFNNENGTYQVGEEKITFNKED